MNASRQNIIVTLYKLLISILIFNSFNCQNIDDDQVENDYYPDSYDYQMTEKVLEFANFPKCCPLDQVSHHNILLRINPDLHNITTFSIHHFLEYQNSGIYFHIH